MDRSRIPPLRALPRFFLEIPEGVSRLEIPDDEFKKIHNVLRLRSGHRIAILPGDGDIHVAVLDDREAVLESMQRVETEPTRKVTLAQALPKPEKLEEVVRMGTELGATNFIVFPSDRSVVKWEPSKIEAKTKRLRSIIRESAEQCFRGVLPRLEWSKGLQEVLASSETVVVLSEVDDLQQSLDHRISQIPESVHITLVVGPEGGWAPREIEWIGEKAVTMGPRVFRVDTAAAAALAVTLCR